jgi:hypothetical protein
MKQIPDTTQLVMNKAEPNKAPIARYRLSFYAARIEENTSGAPFPNASKVTP